MAEFKGYYACIRGGAETAEALPGKVHDVLMVSTAARPDMLPVVQMEPQPDVPDGKVLVRCYRRTAEAIELRYRLDDAPAPALADYDAAMEAHLLAERTARGYTTREPDNYLESSNVRWAQDARDWVAHRDAVMSYALDVMNAVSGGAEPPTLEAFMAGLPKVEWTLP